MVDDSLQLHCDALTCEYMCCKNNRCGNSFVECNIETVIVSSSIGGFLLLLALAISCWKLSCCFRRVRFLHPDKEEASSAAKLGTTQEILKSLSDPPPQPEANDVSNQPEEVLRKKSPVEEERKEPPFIPNFSIPRENDPPITAIVDDIQEKLDIMNMGQDEPGDLMDPFGPVANRQNVGDRAQSYQERQDIESPEKIQTRSHVVPVRPDIMDHSAVEEIHVEPREQSEESDLPVPAPAPEENRPENV